eukprot:CAMPEP_0176192790 /NCGR_PEP_ID=MMETSP0121_2-20121125/5152_1 /TAXON_ID=160619 /ORGANISM="Kryptoperidinium foliaceum, Strain CCMP 1326" /LENGTH=314 /DNA_ID=CAMNT_0017531487 /DNA_START=260 /DNA_END=1202 /DNA_ORIENTATION=+
MTSWSTWSLGPTPAARRGRLGTRWSASPPAGRRAAEERLGALEGGEGPNDLAPAPGDLLFEGGLPKACAGLRAELEQRGDEVQKVGRQDLAEQLPVARPQHPPAKELANAHHRGASEELALANLSASPGVVLGAHCEDHHANGERVEQERVDGAVAVALRRLVGALAPDLAPDPALHRGHREVDQPDLHLRARPAQQDVLQGDVAMRDPQVVQPTNGVDDLRYDRQHVGLALRPWRRHGLTEAPIEKVALRAKGRRDDGLLLGAEDAVQAADVGKVHRGQEAKQADVDPRLLRGVGATLVKLLGPGADPAVRHA